MRTARVDRRFATDIAALVLKVGWYPQHHGGLAAIRTLGRVGVPVFGVHEDHATPAARSSYLTGGFVWPIGGQDKTGHDWLAGLAEIVGRIGRPCVVIPTDDDAAVFLNEHADQLPAMLRQPALASGMARKLVNKKRCLDLVVRAGVPTPATTVARCPTSLSTLGTVQYPVVVKRAERALLDDGQRTYSTVIARTAEELRRLLEVPAEDREVLLQEFIPGGPADNWLFIAYCDAESKSLVSFTGRKLQSYPAYAGETAYAVAENNPGLREKMEQLLKDIGFVGIASIDLRYDRRDQTYRLLDLNPRAGAAFRLFENAHGIDVIRALHLDLGGREVPNGPQRDGRTYVVEPYYLGARRAYLDTGLGWRTWLRCFIDADERAWLTRDDLRPAAAYAMRHYSRRHGRPSPPMAPTFFSGRRHKP
jgi:D-aspartate ligase